MKKKAQVNKLTGFALTIVVFAIVLAVGLAILGKLQTSQQTTSTAFYSNSTFTGDNVTAVDFTPADIVTDSGGKAHLVAGSCTNVKLANASNVDKTAEFTVAGCTAIIIDEDASLNATNIKANFTYTYNVYSASANATASNISHLGEVPGWIPVIIVAMIGGIVLFLVIKQFGGR